MGIAKSRMKKVAPVTVKEENGCHRDGRQSFGPSNSKPSSRRAPCRRSAQADSNSEGLDSEFSAEDLAEEVDRILAECDSTGITLNKMPIFVSETSGLYYAKRKDSNNVYSGNGRNKNALNKQTSNIHVKVRPPQDLMSRANTENTATASAQGMGGGSSPTFDILYDASEEELMNTIERDFG